MGDLTDWYPSLSAGSLVEGAVPPAVAGTSGATNALPPENYQFTASAQKVTNTVKRRRSVDLATNEGFQASGPFTATEVAALEDAVEQYRVANNLSETEVRDLIQDSDRAHRKDTTPLWQHICSALPLRQKPNIHKFARRKFHNYSKRGQWTPEEDAELLRVYEMHPQRWKQIGQVIGRFAEDCRDRYRNYLKCGSAQKMDVWDAVETRQFKEVVNHLLDELRNDVSRSKKKRKLSNSAVGVNEDDLEQLIDWDVVSDRMGRQRSRLQCRNKWEKLKETEVRDAAIDQAYLEAGEDSQKGPSPRYLQAKANYEHMLPGDKFMIIKLIRDSLKSPYRKYEHEIPWQRMQKNTKDKCKWTLPERKICLRDLKKTVKAPKKGGFKAYLNAMLEYLEESYPGRTEDFYEGPLDYIYTGAPKRSKDPRRRPKPDKQDSSHLSSDTPSTTSASTPVANGSSENSSTTSYDTTEDEPEDIDLGKEGTEEDDSENEDQSDTSSEERDGWENVETIDDKLIYYASSQWVTDGQRLFTAINEA